MNQAIKLLEEICRLMELHGDNPFKIRAFEKAAQSLAEHPNFKQLAQEGRLREIPGVGKGIEDVLTQFFVHGRTPLRDELLESLPKGLLQLTEIPGLGPKKARVLIEKLGIHSAGELEYACRENRLLKIKGFGQKLQKTILEGILFKNENQGRFRLSDGLRMAQEFAAHLKLAFPGLQFFETGELRRRLEVLERLDFLVIESEPALALKEGRAGHAGFSSSVFQGCPVYFHYTVEKEFGFAWAKSTGSLDHWKALGSPQRMQAATEEEFYERLDLPWIPPECRETGEEVAFARAGFLDQLLPWNGLRGVFHNHTTRSDGAASLEDMVKGAIALGYEYIGISDHSQSAFYAQGLKESDLKEQEKEIRVVQERYPEIRIFWGIESDILADGSLDYEPQILKKFDFVIASIHSRFQMDRQAMTDRMICAIRNPFTRFIGHPTGRLLLGRKGYELDREAVILEATQHGVAIELNSHPSRLDIDWRWGNSMRKFNAWTSIHPDAHQLEGLKDTDYGVAMARKALISKNRVVNTKTVQEVEKWLKRE